ncbi:MAG: transporter substrate-binding domain-containing protein [Gammaproteobacteria bacterium]|jgi:polar amino acid transport system substrate-binding protein|nr:transporter substrate-binding domain-containing protein [Gammaproteobacteria bacterium]
MNQHPIRMLAILSVLLLAAAEANATQLRLVTSVWPPYVAENLPNGGLAMDIVQTAFERAGYSTDVKVQPWTRNLQGVEIGVYDVVCTIWYTDERARKLAFSEPYLPTEIVFIKRRGGNWTFRSMSSLDGLTVGTVYDYAYGKEFDEATNFRKLPQKHLLQNLLILINGQIDMTLDDRRVLEHDIAEYLSMSADKLEFVSPPLEKRELYIAVSRQTPGYEKIVSDFNHALAGMRSDGTYESILARHGDAR